MRRLDLDRLRSAILDELINGSTVEHLMQLVYDIVGLPEIFFDTAFSNAIGYFTRPFYFKPWETIMRYGHFPEKDMLETKALLSQEAMYKNGRSVYFASGTTEGYPQVCGPVFKGDQLVGYAGLMVEDAFVEDVYAANDMLLSAIGVLFPEENLVSIPLFSAQELRRLLRSGFINKERIRLFEEKFPADYIYIIFSADQAMMTMLEYVQSKCMKELKLVVGCHVNENMLHLLCCAGNLPYYRETLPHVLLSVAEKFQLKCGLSEPFSNIGSINFARDQAIMALSVGQTVRPDSFLYSFRDLYCSIVNAYAADYYGMAVCEINRLKNELNGELYMTLKTFFECDGRCSQTAARLGLHKNSVQNRLHRVFEITGLDPLEPSSAYKLKANLDLDSLFASFNAS